MKKILMILALVIIPALAFPMTARADLIVWEDCAVYLMVEGGPSGQDYEAYNACEARNAERANYANNQAFNDFMQQCTAYGISSFYCIFLYFGYIPPIFIS